ncbi:hypothetical protein A6V25_14870 [Nostoc sp. ATCC 53789]|nr:hypothetical protein A6V25_14870 [Nostoc sp. ATCC 53789]
MDIANNQKNAHAHFCWSLPRLLEYALLIALNSCYIYLFTAYILRAFLSRPLAQKFWQIYVKTLYLTIKLFCKRSTKPQTFQTSSKYGIWLDGATTIFALVCIYA